jgi:hypothetical protein
MKVVLFYLAIAVAAAAMVLLSMGQALTPALPAPQAGVLHESDLHFDAKALAHFAPSPAHYTYVNQEWLAAPTGLQVATKRTWRMPRPDATGVQLTLAPEVGARLARKPLHISIGVLPMKGGTTARELAVSAEDGGPVRWVRRPVTTESGKLEFDLPASAGPVRAIGFWPFSDTKDWWFDFGVEITGVDITAG